MSKYIFPVILGDMNFTFSKSNSELVIDQFSLGKPQCTAEL